MHIYIYVVETYMYLCIYIYISMPLSLSLFFCCVAFALFLWNWCYRFSRPTCSKFQVRVQVLAFRADMLRVSGLGFQTFESGFASKARKPIETCGRLRSLGRQQRLLEPESLEIESF